MKTVIKEIVQTKVTFHIETPYDVNVNVQETKNGYTIEITELIEKY